MHENFKRGSSKSRWHGDIHELHSRYLLSYWTGLLHGWEIWKEHLSIYKGKINLFIMFYSVLRLSHLSWSTFTKELRPFKWSKITSRLFLILTRLSKRTIRMHTLISDELSRIKHWKISPKLQRILKKPKTWIHSIQKWSLIIRNWRAFHALFCANQVRRKNFETI